jgi:hypothetical protein
MIRLTIVFDLEDAVPPRDLPIRFVLALQDAIARAALSGKLDLAHAEECWRVVSAPESA